MRGWIKLVRRDGDSDMTRLWILAIAAMLLGAGTALAQTQPQPPAPNSTTLCPITHDCRPVGQGTQTRPVVPPTLPTHGVIPCPPGTYQIPNTNKCRVK
ncbi:MAG TPA: hypothetical protein VHC39_05150 [Rhizomicrobium sp.]|nr:hypothetical protein [Rhizomicrobium sp.]